MHTNGQIGGLAQPTALGASGLTQTLGIPHLMVVDRQTVLPRQLPVAIKDWAHSDACTGQGVCPKQQPKPSPRGRPVCGDGTLAFSTLGVCMLWREAVQCSGYLFTCKFL